ncbi:uncharacterized protein LOC135391758 [Ornithodoros turicata]|uniref:uncharacterized protein LOC135391758 n=1 Tax=Ornithodoros turicata TaxID=34597 RepID=UPI00313976EE
MGAGMPGNDRSLGLIGIGGLVLTLCLGTVPSSARYVPRLHSGMEEEESLPRHRGHTLRHYGPIYSVPLRYNIHRDHVGRTTWRADQHAPVVSAEYRVTRPRTPKEGDEDGVNIRRKFYRFNWKRKPKGQAEPDGFPEVRAVYNVARKNVPDEDEEERAKEAIRKKIQEMAGGGELQGDEEPVYPLPEGHLEEIDKALEKRIQKYKEQAEAGGAHTRRSDGRVRCLNRRKQPGDESGRAVIGRGDSGERAGLLRRILGLLGEDEDCLEDDQDYSDEEDGAGESDEEPFEEEDERPTRRMGWPQ